MKTTNETSPFKIKGFDSAGTMDEFIAYVEQFDLSGPVWIHEEFHGAHTYWFDESESANVPTVGGVRVDKARMFVDDAGDAMILLGFYDRCSEELSEHKLGESLTKKARPSRLWLFCQSSLASPGGYEALYAFCILPSKLV